jgi:hypothetical protein
LGIEDGEGDGDGDVDSVGSEGNGDGEGGGRKCDAALCSSSMAAIVEASVSGNVGDRSWSTFY